MHETVDEAAPGLRARKRRALRESLVTIAGRRFEADGYDATNMREIADEAGVAYQTLYNHFPNKARLALAWLLRRMDEATEGDAARLAAHAGAPMDAILAAADVYLELVDGLDRTLWREATSEYFHAPEAAAALNAQKLLGPHAQLVDLLRAEHAAGTLRPETDLATLAGVVYVLIDHAVLRFVVQPERSRAVAIAELHDQLELVLRPQLATP